MGAGRTQDSPLVLEIKEIVKSQKKSVSSIHPGGPCVQGRNMKSPNKSHFPSRKSRKRSKSKALESNSRHANWKPSHNTRKIKPGLRCKMPSLSLILSALQCRTHVDRYNIRTGHKEDRLPMQILLQNAIVAALKGENSVVTPPRSSPLNFLSWE